MTNPTEPQAPEPQTKASAAGQSWSASLIDWYRREQRRLPWRESRDPYRVWISEVMLQQTQVATVIGYYERWMARFPDVASLAVADVADVLRAWEGLGYYSRARNLQKAAQQVVSEHGGSVPRSAAELRRLPGIGPYSAGAIASIAFGADEPVVDGNIVRVLTRAFGLEGDPKRAPLHARLWELARSLIPSGQAREFNQALMELGATCCTPRAPRCSGCPVAASCAALAQDRVLEFPQSAPRPRATEVRRAAALIRRKDRFLVVRTAENAPRWAGMWQFPDIELEPEQGASSALARHLAASTGLAVQVGREIASLRHQVTRFRIKVELYGCTPTRGRARALGYGAVRWCSAPELTSLAMPAVHRKIARTLS